MAVEAASRERRCSCGDSRPFGRLRAGSRLSSRAKLDGPNVNGDLIVLAAGNGPNDEKRFLSGRDRVGQRGVRRLVREILLAGEESQECPPLQRYVVADRPPQHGIAGLECIEHRAQRDRRFDFERHLAADVRQRSQMLREYDANHGSVCTSTDSTPGKSRTMGFQLSPASAEA